MNESLDPQPQRFGPYKHDRRHAGLILIMVGAALFVLNNFDAPKDIVIFLLAGGAFLAGYLYWRAYRFLVPACILLGLAIGSIGERSPSMMGIGNFHFVGLGIGFVAVSVIDFFYRKQSHWWPLIPGLILIVLGASSESREVGRIIAKGWPLLLVVIGILMWMGLAGKSKEDQP